ncbi:MAG: hypothetical protein ACPGSI_02740 [Pikeienuella sp.]
MDIISGLTAAKLAFDLAKELRGIDASVSEAEFKLKLADLISAQADIKIALSHAKVALAEKDAQLRDLEDRLYEATNGQRCPVCRVGRLSVQSTEDHGYNSVQFHQYCCDSDACTHEETRTYDPDAKRK